MSQIQKWYRDIKSDMHNWREILEDLEPAKGYTLVTGTTIDEEHKLIEISINCDKNLEPAGKAIREQLSMLNIPQELVAITVAERARPDILGHNKLEECNPPHPAGFGGYFYTDETTFHVYLLHPSQDAAEEMMFFQLGPPRWNEVRTIYPIQGDYTYTQLQDWYGHFFEDWWQHYTGEQESEYLKLVTIQGYQHESPPTLTHAGVSPKLNRVLLRISPDADVDATWRALEERLTALEIPNQAVVIEIEQSLPTR